MAGFILKHRSMTPAQYVAAPLTEGVTAAITHDRDKAKVYPSMSAALTGKQDDLGAFAQLFEIVPGPLELVS